jgi:hypothetical protein
LESCGCRKLREIRALWKVAIQNGILPADDEGMAADRLKVKQGLPQEPQRMKQSLPAKEQPIDEPVRVPEMASLE